MERGGDARCKREAAKTGRKTCNLQPSMHFRAAHGALSGALTS